MWPRIVCLIGLSLVSSLPVIAKDVYIAESAAGAANGVDCANARPASFFNTAANWGPGASQIGPGDTVHLCGTISVQLVIQASGAAGSPTTILFEPDAKMSTLAWPVSGAIRSFGKSNIVIDGGTNGLIENRANGTARAIQIDSRGISLDQCNDCVIRNVTVRDIYVRTPLSNDSRDFGGGIAISGNRVQIYNNFATEANTCFFYFYPGSTTTSNVRIFRNTGTHCSNGIIVGSGNTGAIGDDIQIFENDLSDGVNWDGTWTPPPSDGHHHNDGIQVFAQHTGSRLTNLRVFSNFVHGDWGTNITGWIFFSGNVVAPQIYNNLMTASGTSFPSNGFVTIFDPSDTIIFNNTIVGNTTPGAQKGIGIYFVGQPATGHRIKNNIVMNVFSGIFLNAGISIAESDFNIFFNLSLNEMRIPCCFLTFANWQIQTGLDPNSRKIDPALNANSRPTPTSPAVDGGTDTSPIVTVDIKGLARPQLGRFDIGAFEFSRPDPPTNLRTIP